MKEIAQAFCCSSLSFWDHSHQRRVLPIPASRCSSLSFWDHSHLIVDEFNRAFRCSSLSFWDHSHRLGGMISPSYSCSSLSFWDHSHHASFHLQQSSAHITIKRINMIGRLHIHLVILPPLLITTPKVFYFSWANTIHKKLMVVI